MLGKRHHVTVPVLLLAVIELTVATVILFTVPSNAQPSPVPLDGDSVSLEEAARLASNIGFTLERPSALPSSLKYMEVQVTGSRIIDVQRPWIESLSTAILIYSKEPINASATTLPDLLTSGGIIVNERKRDPGFDQSINDTLTQKGEVGVLKTITVNGNVITSMQTGEIEAVTINGNRGILITTVKPYFYMNYSQLKWGDKQVAIHLLAGSDYYTKNDLLTIAESFTDWSAIKTSTTTDTVTIISTIQTVSKLTKTTTLSQLHTLTETVTKETSEKSTEPIEPMIYAWAVSATVAAVVLTVVVILLRKGK